MLRLMQMPLERGALLTSETASIFAALAGDEPRRIIINSTHLKAHRNSGEPPKKGSFPPYRPHESRAELKCPHV
jgi:hypothetical protein